MYFFEIWKISLTDFKLTAKKNLLKNAGLKW